MTFPIAFRTIAANCLQPVARAYLQFMPFALGKEAIWNYLVRPFLGWRPYRFRARTEWGAIMDGILTDIVPKYVYYFGLWEPNLSRWLRERIPPDTVFVDIGANIGYFSLLAAARVGRAGRVVAIEASRDIFVRLQDNIALNGVQNVRLENVAAWHSRTQLMLYDGPSDNTGTTTVNHDFATQFGCKAREFVTAMPLGDILREEEISRVRIIKIDAEGAEDQIVQGILHIMDRLPYDVEIVVEVTPIGDNNDTVPLVEALRNAGFHPYRIRNDYCAQSYLRAIHRKDYCRPTRFDGSIVAQTDLIFSRVDSDRL